MLDMVEHALLVCKTSGDGGGMKRFKKRTMGDHFAKHFALCVATEGGGR